MNPKLDLKAIDQNGVGNRRYRYLGNVSGWLRNYADLDVWMKYVHELIESEMSEEMFAFDPMI